jgi:ureidoglycolate hydrolase
LHVKEIEEGPARSNAFVPDLVTLHLDGRMPASVCVAKVGECERVINFMEYHQYTSEGVLPLDGDIIIYVAKSGRVFDSSKIQAFRVPKGTFVKLNPGTMHGRQFVDGTPEVSILILLPERTFGNDFQSARLEGDDCVKIL